MDPKHLNEIQLFAKLSKRERDEVARQADEIDVDAGKQLIGEGRFAYEFFVIEDGRAEVVRAGEQIAELGPGDFFGEMALLSDETRNASVVATTPMTAVVMTGQAFRALKQRMPDVAEQIRAACRERGQSLRAGQSTN